MYRPRPVAVSANPLTHTGTAHDQGYKRHILVVCVWVHAQNMCRKLRVQCVYDSSGYRKGEATQPPYNPTLGLGDTLSILSAICLRIFMDMTLKTNIPLLLQYISAVAFCFIAQQVVVCDAKLLCARLGRFDCFDSQAVPWQLKRVPRLWY